MSLRTALTERYGVVHPIAAAGMAFAGMTPDLAVAVTRAGGIGSLGVGKLPPEAVGQLIDGIAAGCGDLPFNVNFITIFTDDAHIAVCAERRVPIVSFHWGHPPTRWIDQLHAAGCDVWEQVGTVEDARRAVGDGIDVIVAQGTEAGGHNFAALPTFVQTPTIVDAVAPVPVLASGGISDGRGLAASLALGAAGAWVGTRLVATREAFVHEEYKDQIVASAGTETVRTSLFGPDDPAFNPMRVLRNAIVHDFHDAPDSWPTSLDDQPRIGTWRFMGMEAPMPRFTNFVPTRESEGDVSQMPLLAGQGVGMITDVPSAGDVVQRMSQEAEHLLDRLGAGAP
ncbi:NAD(P)H-dependent flavin oxidoreductase [Nitriliruptor alkaliphilus]|uniref:NAD(P)H-dependent flavin oxidoreductase n=1 Tax=Nitriliruptor alkaliphilus TaxID=427918 RepID=UPI000697DE85|nr:nitronate monooxygenase [Nitriliruptor alkaliphilus]